MNRSADISPTVFTIGHSTRTLDEFIMLLRTYGIARLVDVRTIPRSRHNPQFKGDSLSRFLRNRRISYLHMKALGGLRHARADSPNMAWQNDSFRGFADYMLTEEFQKVMQKLIILAVEKPLAIMCAEALPWRCHRSLIADALIVRGIDVRHIMSLTSTLSHSLTSFAKVDGTRLLYPG